MDQKTLYSDIFHTVIVLVKPSIVAGIYLLNVNNKKNSGVVLVSLLLILDIFCIFSHFYNILILLNVLRNFTFTKSETKCDN